ncbi:Auxin efflux carrier component [Heracleum sosnowskyi]|uniref:Auxin efflux carrier component n=1 Tax=Heracleum sosnowskyi TaxID=360622 RepID=A0AAD8MPE8_9APIA|nr:Auxin efflux carrier component [Heracleum sosnowskyi]
MIGIEDIYKVIVATTPLYVALILGYGCVKWWHIFTNDQCDAINLLVCYITLPLFTFEFTANVDPFAWNFVLIGADAISKVIIVGVLALWVKFSSKGSYGWSITSFSLSTLTNSLVVGVPLLQAMYGPSAVDLVVQLSVVQAIIWLTLLLFVLEFRRTQIGCMESDQEIQVGDKDLEGDMSDGDIGVGPSFCYVMMKVWLKLAMNPNSYACIVGITWACVANRWHLEMPSILEGSILIMSRAGTGTAMFSMGLFMARQKKVVACGSSLTALGMVLKFVAGPAAMAIACLAVGLHGDVLRVAIIQAALPQSITSFIYAKEYGLHADVLSTAVIFGMLVSLPLLIGYYAILAFLH